MHASAALQCGCVGLAKEGSKELLLCRNAVQVGSLAQYFLDTDEGARGVAIPVLTQEETEAVLKRHVIPDDGSAAFNRLMQNQT